MHELKELKEMLCEELKEYGEKELTAGSLDVIDKLSHAIKNLDKIIESYEDEGYSGNYMYDYRDGSYRGGSYRDNSYARGRRGNVRRDAMGRYSRDEGMIAELHELMEGAPNEKTKQEFKRFIEKIERM